MYTCGNQRLGSFSSSSLLEFLEIGYPTELLDSQADKGFPEIHFCPAASGLEMCSIHLVFYTDSRDSNSGPSSCTRVGCSAHLLIHLNNNLLIWVIVKDVN